MTNIRHFPDNYNIPGFGIQNISVKVPNPVYCPDRVTAPYEETLQHFRNKTIPTYRFYLKLVHLTRNRGYIAKKDIRSHIPSFYRHLIKAKQLGLVTESKGYIKPRSLRNYDTKTFIKLSPHLSVKELKATLLATFAIKHQRQKAYAQQKKKGSQLPLWNVGSSLRKLAKELSCSTATIHSIKHEKSERVPFAIQRVETGLLGKMSYQEYLSSRAYNNNLRLSHNFFYLRFADQFKGTTNIVGRQNNWKPEKRILSLSPSEKVSEILPHSLSPQPHQLDSLNYD